MREPREWKGMWASGEEAGFRSYELFRASHVRREQTKLSFPKLPPYHMRGGSTRAFGDCTPCQWRQYSMCPILSHPPKKHGSRRTGKEVGIGLVWLL
jgi:hypothetical protein